MSHQGQKDLEKVLENAADVDPNDLARNLRSPEKGSGPVGILVKSLLETNISEELNAAHLSRIEPHHNVLELGFGLGLGLKEAFTFMRDGTGTLCGIELSEAMLEEASNRLASEMQTGRINVKLGSVDSMPFKETYFDRVFHCNCFYFWPDLVAASREIWRVMKPGAFMVTVLDLKRIAIGEKVGALKYGKADPEPYMEALKSVGFVNVKMEVHKRTDDTEYQAIFAHIPHGV